MTLKIKNTLSKKKENFIPLEKGKVRFYQCGPTLYWDQHIGNLRSVTLADFMNRSLKYLGYDVTFVRNYTDVGHLSGDNDGDADTGEDRMEKAAKRENINPKAIAEKYRLSYEKDIKKLNTLFPDHTPKVTEYIPEQIAMIKVLLEKGFAYTTPLAIYFDICKAKDYHRLSGQSAENNLCGAGTGDVSDKDKKQSSDFALWFFKAGVHKNALQTWDAPEFNSILAKDGRGFPGWHLECSAMGKALLGDTIDLKLGGIEHIPIHHTNEIAQSESANGTRYVKYWLHNEHLLVDNKKMSKSTGTSFLLNDIEEKGFSPLDLRYFFLQAHYRSKQNFTWKALEASKTAREKLTRKINALPNAGEINTQFKNKFISKIEDDFSTPEALAVVWEIFKSDITDANKKATILDFDKILGLSLQSNNIKEGDVKLSDTIKGNPQIASLLDDRKKARQDKDWETSDELREEIKALGYKIIDSNDGQKIEKL